MNKALKDLRRQEVRRISCLFYICLYLFNCISLKKVYNETCSREYAEDGSLSIC